MRIKLSYVADDDSVNDGANQPAQEQVSRLPLLDCESPHRERCCDPDDSVPNSSLPDTEQSQNHVGNVRDTLAILNVLFSDRNYTSLTRSASLVLG